MRKPGSRQRLHITGIPGAIMEIKPGDYVIRMHLLQDPVKPIRGKSRKGPGEFHNEEQIRTQRPGCLLTVCQGLNVIQRVVRAENRPGIRIKGQDPPGQSQLSGLFGCLFQQSTVSFVKPVKESRCQNRMRQIGNICIGKPADLHHQSPLAQANTSPWSRS